MSYDLLIRNARIVRPEGVIDGAVGIAEGRIVAAGAVEGDARETVDAGGNHLLPGLIDTQVHFREPGLTHKEDLESGSRAAVLGGVTSYLEMPNTFPPTTSPEALAEKLDRAEGRSWAHFGFFVGATEENSSHLAAYERLPGTPGIKMFMGSSTGGLLVAEDGAVGKVLASGTRRVAVHAEDEAMNRAARDAYQGHDAADHPHVRSAESALAATNRLLRLAEEAGRPVHILHISTGQEPDVIADAKARGVAVTCEVTPQHLFFTTDDLHRGGTKLQMNPPVRGGEHRERLWATLSRGVFDVFGSDHAPHALDEKAQPYPTSPSGMPGVQTMLRALLTFVADGKLSLERLVAMACENPARLYGIAGKGRIDVGYDADLVLVDPDAQREMTDAEIASKCGWTPYAGRILWGEIQKVWVGGQLTVDAGTITGKPHGRMLRFTDPSPALPTRE